METGDLPNISSKDDFSQQRFGQSRNQKVSDGSGTFNSHKSFSDTNSLLTAGHYMAKMYPSDEKLYFKGLLSVKKQDDL